MTESTLSHHPNRTAEDSARPLHKHWREGLALPLLIGALIFGAVTLIPAMRASAPLVDAILVMVYAAVGLVAVVRFPYLVRAGVFLIGVFVIGLSGLLTHGILGNSLFFFLAFVLFSTMMLSTQAGLFAIILDLLTFTLFGGLMLSGRLMPMNPSASPARIEDWLGAGAAIAVFGAVIVLAFRRLENEFASAQAKVEETLNMLREERSGLENKVRERTMLFRKVNEIGQAVTAILDPEELLSYAAQRIQDEFDCYFTAFYSLDATSQWVELKKAGGEAGKVLQENRHRLEAAGKSLVARVIREKQGRIAAGQEIQQALLDNPLLPYTRSQIVLPLIVGNKIHGALEMRSTKEDAFQAADLEAYQNLANEIAIALENSRLFQEAEQSLQEMRAAQRQYIQSVWRSHAEEKSDMEYMLGDPDLPGAEKIEVPLSLRGQVIGQIQLENTAEWTPEQRNVVEAIASQATLALENARLVEESQSIAARERIANEIISKVWASPNMDSILQTTVRELGRALAASEVEIEISTQDDNGQ